MPRILGHSVECSRIRRAVSMILLLNLPFVAQCQELTEHQTVLVKGGQVLVLQLLSPLDSARAQVGDDVSLKLFLPFTINGMTVLPAGSPVHGRIISVRKAGRNCKQGVVVWEPDQITTADGRTIVISVDQRTGMSQKRSDRRFARIAKGTAAAPLVIGALPWFVILSIGMREEGCGGAYGTEEKVPAGAVLSAEVSKDVVLSPTP